MEKVIAVNVKATDIPRENTKEPGSAFREIEFPQINKLLEEGYVVKSIHPGVPGKDSYTTTFFVLKKD